MRENYNKQGYLREDFRLFHLDSAAGVKTEYHYHEFCKLLLLLSGRGGYWIEGQRYSLESGDIVLVGSGCIHRPEFEPGSPYERIIIYISPDYLRQFAGEDCDLLECFSGKHGCVLRSDQGSHLVHLAGELEQTLSAEDYGNRILSMGTLLRLLVEITRQLRLGGSMPPGPPPVKHSRVAQIMDYIDTHLTEDLTVDMLAENFYWSKYHMMRCFRNETGSSIHAYITQRRLMLARELISQGLSATESCFRSGFGSYSAFTRTYGKFFGTTPTGRICAAKLPEESYE